MTGICNLTPEQEAFAAHVGSSFVHACPGAGKTRTIIARLAKISATLPSRRGVAVLSFTNSAIDEFRERCHVARLESLLKFPSFAGTLDAFVRRFVVLPSLAARSAMRPTIVDSWEALGIEVRLSGQYAFRGDAVSLDMFDPETNIIDPARIGHAGLQNHVRQHQARYQQAAALRRRGLLQAGYLSAGDARVVTLLSIQHSVSGVALGRALAARFHEVMVDEGQDCNPLDLQILSWLRKHGVRVTFVCDPDQAIYEFRKGNPAGIQEFKATYPIESHRKLTGNFRSSPAICKLAATLRTTAQADNSVGDASNVGHPVQLLTYGGRGPTATIGQAFLDWLAEHHFDSTDAIVLAHSGKVALRATGTAPNDSNGNSRIEELARKVAAFWSPTATARSKEAVVQLVETMLLDLMGLRDNNEHMSRTVERLGLDKRELRRRALSILVNLPRECGNSDAERLGWITCVHSEIERMNLSLPNGVTVRSFFRRPSNTQWSNHLLIPTDLALACAKIHEAKGREYGAVCVVIPPNRAPANRCDALFDSWEARSDSEAKRVLYVGLTRAQQLCALAVPITFADRCAALLTAGEVPYVRRDLGP